MNESHLVCSTIVIRSSYVAWRAYSPDDGVMIETRGVPFGEVKKVLSRIEADELKAREEVSREEV